MPMRKRMLAMLARDGHSQADVAAIAGRSRCDYGALLRQFAEGRVASDMHFDREAVGR